MSCPKTYGSLVNKLPVNQKKKNFLIRNWKGALAGGIIIPILAIFTLAIGIGSSFAGQESTILVGLGYLLAWPVAVLKPLENTGALVIILMILFEFAYGAMLGVFIQETIRRIRK